MTPDRTEQEQIVAWLRKRQARCLELASARWFFGGCYFWCSIAFDIAADAIERGDHHAE